MNKLVLWRFQFFGVVRFFCPKPQIFSHPEQIFRFPLCKKIVGHWNESVFPLEFFLIFPGCAKSLENLSIGKRY